MNNPKKNINNYIKLFFSILTVREKRAFWLMTGINIFFLLVMTLLTPASVFLTLAFGTVVQAAIVLYYVLVNKLDRKTKTREWVEAIGFAVVAATLIRTFLIEAYTIPSASMEKSLLIGDFLFVSKVNYGARAPMTPVSFPFAHNTMPLVGGNSYTTLFSMPYYRLPGFQKIKNNDVVVFNYPAEDGRPADKKENYIKRCLAIGGDSILIINQQVFINGKQVDNPPKMQHKYYVKTDGGGFSQKTLKDLEITDGSALSPNGDFEINMTDDALAGMRKIQHVKTIDSIVQARDVFVEYVFPFRKELPWNVDNFGPLYVPQAGATITIDTINYWIYERIIRNYEGNKSFEMVGNKFLLNGEEVTQYTFKQDYYFMMGDNRHYSSDSRMWGFVPHDHIVGKALFIWLSLDQNERNLLKKVRWGRIFKGIK
jgi:signal peptidase I